MDTTSYVPNNPQFGVQFECNWSAPTSIQQISSCNDDLSSCWSDEMGSFSLPLDLDPLPSLFNISPCGNGSTSSRTEPNYQSQNQLLFRDQKQPSSDVADVLLSLKHAVVHPGQSPTDKYDTQLYHSQMLLSPGGYSGANFCDQNFALSHQQAPIFPSMSVNVSMNMTMHGYHPNGGYTSELPCPQVQWSANTQGSSQPNYQNQGLLSPTYGGTYSFTADFRPPVQDSSPLLTTTATYKPMMTFSSPRRRSSLSLLEEDGQKPNVCRICGKSYARPSTLKTHLRTHSGEKPFRCGDCNKSFSQAANLTAHVRTHSGEKPFRCPVCDRRFSQSSSVTTHMRTHSGERPYRCRLCKKAFSDSSTLTKHLRIHSGEKPYECKLCLLRFSQSGNLNRHMRVHGTTNGLPP
ncbi:protein glass [Euwallacea similis]|uniref:protein glass n=1 Tax=Euwallacea similis TaxID=1736056 RepID=UPI00344BC7F5